MYWIKVDKTGPLPIESPFLLRDEHGYIYEGSTAFDYYDAEYWFPMPLIPPVPCITNDQWIVNALKSRE